MRNRIRLFYVTLAFAFLGATPAMAQNYLVSGQVHPQFRLEVAINGEVIKSVTPNPSKPKIFLTQIDPSIISDGQNSLTVSYDVVSEEEGGTAPEPSFKVRIVRPYLKTVARRACRQAHQRLPICASRCGLCAKPILATKTQVPNF